MHSFIWQLRVGEIQFRISLCTVQKLVNLNSQIVNLILHKCAFLQPSDVSHQLGVKGNYLIDRQTINAVTVEGYFRIKNELQVAYYFLQDRT